MKPVVLSISNIICVPLPLSHDNDSLYADQTIHTLYDLYLPTLFLLAWSPQVPSIVLSYYLALPELLSMS